MNPRSRASEMSNNMFKDRRSGGGGFLLLYCPKAQKSLAQLQSLEFRFDWGGEVWEKSYRTEENEHFFEQAYDDLVGRLGQYPGSLALDIGCGICANSIQLAKRGYSVWAADYSEPIRAQALNNVEHHRLSNRITIQPHLVRTCWS